MTLEIHLASEITDFYPVDDRTPEAKFGRYLSSHFELEIVDRRDNFLIGQAGLILSQNRSFVDRRLVKSVEFEEDIESSDQVKIVLLNPELRLSNSTIFVEGNSIDVFMAYDNRPRFFMGRGIITEITRDYNDQEPTIVLTGHDISYFMMDEQRAEIVPDGSRWHRTRRPPPETHRSDEIVRRICGFGIDPTYLVEQDTQATTESQPTYEDSDDERGMSDPSSCGTCIEETGYGLVLDNLINGHPGIYQLPEIVIQSNVSDLEHFGQRRDAGHVWSGLADSEIAAAIFRKYGVVPYVQETDEHRLRRSSSPADPDVIQLPEINIIGNPNGRSTEEDPTFEQDNQSGIDEVSRLIAELEGNISAEDQESICNRLSQYRQEETTQPQEDNRRRVVQRAGTTDWDFLTELAKKHNYICFVFFDYESRQWIGYWGPEENIPQNREYIFWYAAGAFTSLKLFRPSSSTRNQATQIDLLYVDPLTRQENRLRVNMQSGSQSPAAQVQEESNPDPVGTGPEVVLEINGRRSVVHANHRFTSAIDAQNWLMAYWRRHAADFQVVEGETIVGIPELRARQYHIFRGVQRDSGRYFVTYARHIMESESSYTTTFTCRKTPAVLTEQSDLTVESEEMNNTAPAPLPANVA